MDKLTVIVPYRDREEHLEAFIQHMKFSLPHAEFCIVEQDGEKPFNRGKLLNIGFLETQADYYCFHDVDMLPLQVDYSYPVIPTQLAKSSIQTSGFFGAVTMFNKRDFMKANGFNNTYFHRAEDNEMWFNLKRILMPYRERFGVFRELSHERPAVEFDPVLWEKAKHPRPLYDGLSHTSYTVTERTQIDNFKMLKCSI